ncbi:MAG TPA: glycoside hydrolase family 2 TIM barrel-domain containing protein [Chitinophagaceae bacterium]|nr:glycoside hydrolase family 2 TIM barrel-domain containing protein [Chitinophagaceae bacterium]
MKKFCFVLLVALLCSKLFAQNTYELNSGWLCKKASEVKDDGIKLSNPSYTIGEWMQATVPGTVLTTLLNNKLVPDPFYGMNNEKIPDIYNTGREYYTYWFVKDFKEHKPGGDGLVWLTFRGINYSCDFFLNGHKLNTQPCIGMFLRQEFDITPYLANDGNNRLAVIVYPPDPVGNPNGGQGGDGEIAHSITQQYVAGWDWIQPVRDRNTGIWDKVIIKKTNSIIIKNPHIITLVAGARLPAESVQVPAVIKVTAEIKNALNKPVKGVLKYELAGTVIKQNVVLQPGDFTVVQMPDDTLKNPKLWWPNGYGPQNMYSIKLQFVSSTNVLCDELPVKFGVRQLQTKWNERTGSMQLMVNGQKIFVKGGNWIISDEMLRFSNERYDAEVRFHRDMNLNMIRVWGGAITERPEFYDACDKYGILVFQDFWNSGDCNGRWQDPMKKENQWVRRQYPDDHQLFLASAADQVKLIRNHPSLAFWCGGNEIPPTDDILFPLKDSIIATLDGTRYFFDYSNSDSMSFNTLGGNGDGPYGIQDIKTFFAKRTFPFNSEVGSVGVGDYASLERFLPRQDLEAFPSNDNPDSVWRYHKYIGYRDFIDAYGKPSNTKDFANKAQLVNYDQYRGLVEGFTTNMWNWYTGFIIWKTQNPWTALRGQMYDYYLDPNACLYGLHEGSEPLHIMFNAADSMVMIANNTFTTQRNLMMRVKMYDMQGKSRLITDVFNEIGPTTVKNYIPIANVLAKMGGNDGLFLSLRLLNEKQEIISDNLYWLPDSTGVYSGLQHIAIARVSVKAVKTGPGKAAVTINAPAGGPVAFFSRISVVDPDNHKRILPVFYSDNYISVLPGESKTITVDFSQAHSSAQPLISIEGWNVQEQFIEIE